MLTLVTAIGIALVPPRGDRDGDDDDDGDFKVPDRPGGGPPVNPVLYIKVTAAPRPSRQQVVHRVCTTSNSSDTRFFPEDGLCDFLFYTSLEMTATTNDFSMQSQYHLQPFIQQAQAATNTRYGMSIDLRDVKRLMTQLATPEGIADYESYWSVNIADWGFLTVNEFQSEAQYSDVMDALKILKTLHQRRTSKSTVPAYTFLGIYFKADLCEIMANDIRSIFTPTGIIVLGHISYGDNNRSDCTIMPPTNLKNPRFYRPDVRYGHSISDAVDAANCLRNRGVHTNYSVSVTMQGRFYTTRSAGNVPDGESHRYLYQDCSSSFRYEQRGSIQEMCDNQNLGYATNIRYDNSTMSLITFDRNFGYALTFDNEQTLRFKVCDAWNAAGTKLGIAVYDVDYDSNSTRCDPLWIKGSWERLRFLSRLNAFVRQNYMKPNYYTSCLQDT